MMEAPRDDVRARRWIAAALLGSCVPLGLGCQTTHRRDAKPEPAAEKAIPKHLDATAGIKADPAIARAGFEAKATADQEVGVHMDMGRGHESRGQYEAAAVDYQRALEALEKPNPARGSAGSVAQQKATAHRKLAVMLDLLGRFAQSDVHYKAALKLAPDDPKVWNNAGYSLYMQGRFEEAERTLRTAVRLAPGDTMAPTNLGLALTAQGKVDEAVKLMTRAIGAPAAHANVGFVLAANGRRAEAVGHYRVALALQPKMPEAEAALARLAKEGEPTATADAPPLPPSGDDLVQPAAAEAPAKRGLFGRTRR